MQAIAISVLLGSSALAQSFPWEIFTPRTLKEVIFSITKAVRPDDHMFLAQNQLESRVEVVFTGKLRPLGKARKTFISTWFGMLRSEQKKLAELYDHEYLHKEGEAEYWLPTSTPITKYFAKELKPGEVRAGNVRGRGNFSSGAGSLTVIVGAEVLPSFSRN